jgi:serine/threonine-protein kinase
VVLYELTTGHRLFKRANELLVLRALTQDAVPVPSRKIVDYPAALERVVMRALSRDPDRRQATALELRSELLATIPFEGNPRVALAMIMEELFPERIAEKRELVRNVRAGTEVPNIPAAEVDESVEMPGVEGQRTGSLVASSRSGLLWAIVLVLLAAGGVAGAWWYTEYGRSESSPSPSPSPSVSSMPVASAAPALVTNDATEAIDAAQRFVVHVESIPSGATLIVDGETKGVTPFDLERAAPGRIGLELQLEGHVSVRQDLDVEHEQHLLIPLPDVPVAAPATTPSPRPHKKPKPDPFQRFD